MSNLTDAIQNDLDAVFFSGSGFDEAVSYTPSGGSASSINIIWDDAFETIEFGDGGEVRMVQPAAFAKASDITGDTDGDTIVRSSTTYYVTRKLGADGIGDVVILLLSKRAIHG